MTDPQKPAPTFDAVTTPIGNATICPQCGATLEVLTTSCGQCGAMLTAGGPGGERVERMLARLQTQIGPQFQLQGLIGRGGMGIVFKARDAALERDVALKVLAFDPVMHPDAFVRFEREARLAARLDHPNIVPIFSVGQGDGVAFYTMRFVRGGSLEALVAREGPLPLDHAVRLLRDVASALDFAHEQGVVHRDIKPANILLSDSGHAMVADFGIARAFTGDAVTSTSGSHTGVVGSPAYMAPEQWRGDRPDGRADQYALGVLAFELLSGMRPFRDVSMQELLRMHLGEAPPALESVRRGLPPRVGRAIHRAMAKEPADRFPSAASFVAAVAGDAGADAARAPADARPPRAVSEGARSRQWAGNAFAAVMVLTAVAVGVTAWRRSVGRPATPSTVPAPMVDTLAARLAQELEETRKIALDAQRRAERAEASQGQALSAAAARASVGHVAIVVRGGAPRVLIDGQDAAPSTPAIIDVPPGRHVVRVAETGRRYLPAQFVIDVSAGDTSKLVFADPRVANRELLQGQQAMRQLPQSQTAQQGRPRMNRQISADTAALGPGTASGVNAPAGAMSGQSSNPFVLPDRVWRHMSPQEQAMLTSRWDRMSPEQRQRAVNDMKLREATGGFPRRQPGQKLPARPTPP